MLNPEFYKQVCDDGHVIFVVCVVSWLKKKKKERKKVSEKKHDEERFKCCTSG